MRHVQAQVTGRVQGVMYRESCRREAERLGVTGWVRNEPDGSVAVEASGPEDAVESLLAWCRQGPPGARVERVDVTEVEPSGLSGFEVRW
ncbi:MAG: acylphosphatase [Nocardioides sp.]